MSVSPESPITPADIKAVLRKQALVNARSAASAYGVEAGGRVARTFLAAVRLQPGCIVGGYAPLRSEIDPIPLLTRLSTRGHAIALPVIQGLDRPLRFRSWHPGEKLQSGQFGARQPLPEARELAPDCLIVPLLAFDGDFYRLGRGGGFYDRTIAELNAQRPVMTIGLAFSALRLPNIPHEPHDQRLDWIVTEEGAAQRG